MKDELPFRTEYHDRLDNPNLEKLIIPIIDSKAGQSFTFKEFEDIRIMTYDICKKYDIIKYVDQNKIFHSELINYTVIRKWAKQL